MHSAGKKDTAPGEIAANYPNAKLQFSWDNNNGAGGEFFNLLGGVDIFPYTVVLDENGVVVKTIISKLDYNTLKSIVDENLK